MRQPKHRRPICWKNEAIRRACHGVQKPITAARKREIIHEYSDTMLIFLLKGADHRNTAIAFVRK